MTLLAKRYAQALHTLAAGRDEADVVGAHLQGLDAALAMPALRAMLTSPDVRAPERADVLEKLGRGRHELVRNLLGVLLHRHRLEVLFDLYPAYRALQLAARGEVEGVVETPFPLGDPEMLALTSLAGRLSGKKVSLTADLRPELLGGVRLRIGNVLYDGSMQTALGQLEHKLMQATV
jgi:F-type H+-transporting ATPase subunit delta